jgi:hypothetical protein
MYARLLAIVLAIAGIWCLSQQSRAQFSSRTCHIGDAGFCAPASSGAPPTLDHIGRTTTSVYTNPNTFSLQTVAGEKCIVVVATNGTASGVDTIIVTDSASNSYPFRVNSRNVPNINSTGNTLSEFSTTAGTTATVTVNVHASPGASVTYVEAYGWCLSGVNATPFDSLAPSVAISGAVTISTSHNTSFISNALRNAGPIACPGVWTSLEVIDFGQACYQRFTSTQSGLTCADINTNNGIICDAVDGP